MQPLAAGLWPGDEGIMNGNALNEWEVTGRARTHVRQWWQPRFAAMPEAADAFLAMREAARVDGIDLLPCASYRPFEAQLRNWNRKSTGDVPLHDIAGHARDYAALTPIELIYAIMGWTALPGASRRHWGSDIDVFDRTAVPPGYRLKLLPEEVAQGGVFERLHDWLDTNIAGFGFFRPYRTNRGGMYPAPWHLSHFASAQRALAAIDIDLLTRVIRQADMSQRDLVLELLPEIFGRFVLNVDPPSHMHGYRLHR
jgi:LAS superfamily LD-carboxypeptidase LdcB